MSNNLRPYQSKAIETLRESVSRHERPILALPTGAGKTRIASAIFDLARAKDKRVAFVVPMLGLIDQTVKAFYNAGLNNIGVIQGKHIMEDWSRPVQICSIQTIAKRQKVPIADVVIFDEIHVMYKAHEWWMKEADPKTCFIGLSATPWRKGLNKWFNRLIVAETTRGLTEQGYLAPLRTFAPSHPDLSKVKTVAGDYHEGQLADAMNKPTLTADVVTTWISKAEQRPTICFAVDRAHADSLTRQFDCAGVSAAYVDAYTAPREREEILSELRTGLTKVICNIGTMIMGIDAPWVSCISLARPTKSEMLFVQMTGRSLRIFEDKKDSILLDHSDTALRLGLPDTIYYDELLDGDFCRSHRTAKTREPLPRECPCCHFVRPAHLHACPACGYVSIRQSDITYSDGELTEFNSEGRLNGHRKTAEELSKEMRQAWYSGLIYIAMERQYKDGWAANQYRSKFGVWPNSLRKVPTVPAKIVRDWVKSRQIAYAKAIGRKGSNAARGTDPNRGGSSGEGQGWLEL